ncbi:hypothetical protein C672_3584 [[Clostridium] bifermentans ATCC 638]|uniref:Uncharacterized protein n=1 Tax=Paraclostridium bifermentans ATCC 638 = DSM 14991 TaxID=1233171 RepID=T4VFE3_PARBF|nr:hypothetical protein [Paraclostridium bifermentans]EQK39835.1 hypothetical protein C672_3584 [[Clostridium] bifermentans ATCC 638] [Paraclostridium bifermentans ATCC 638 = DSM 14991]RIZ57415.1 hypothetical protein CHH45_16390 [Paraclostridium bifermentans]
MIFQKVTKDEFMSAFERNNLFIQNKAKRDKINKQKQFETLITELKIDSCYKESKRCKIR